MLELTISMTVLTVVVGATTFQLDRQARSLGRATQAANEELGVDIVMDGIVQRLKGARWSDTSARLAQDLAGGGDVVALDATRGFPPVGTLVVDPGHDDAERLSWDAVDAVDNELTGVVRALMCTDAAGFLRGTTVQWEGVARVIEDQGAPDDDTFDGVSLEMGRPTFFVGDGTGVVFQVPVRAVGDEYFGPDGEMVWGASIAGTETLDGFCAYWFRATDTLLEATIGRDLNGDGDQGDTFDLGQIRFASWDADDPDAGIVDSAVSRAIFAQERCNYGGDLDGDGSADPMFLFDPRTGRLRLRFFTVRTGEFGAELRRDETSLFMLNSVED